MKQRIVMTLMYAIEGVDPGEVPDRVEQQSVTSADYESMEPLASARGGAECLVQIIRAYSRKLSLAEQHAFWTEIHSRLDNTLR
jgi:hypothetical protein